MITNTEEFEVTDIYLAAFLKVSGCTLLRRRRQANRVYFIFTNPAGPVQELREAFFTGQAKVPAHQYAIEIKAMKELCHEG